MGRARVRVMTMCLVLVKIYGISPIELLNIIRISRGIINLFNPLVFESSLNSIFKDKNRFENIAEIREGIIQYTQGINISPSMVLIQLS
jgi:hypothetical protein